MSEEVVIDFRATADFGQVSAQAKMVQAQVEALRGSILGMNAEVGAGFQTAVQQWKSAMSTGGQFVTQQLALSSSADKFADSLSRGKLSYRQATAAMKEYTTSANKAHTELGRLIVQQELLQKRSSFLASGRDSSGKLTGVLSTPTGMTQKELDKFFGSSKAGLNQIARLEEVANQKLIDLGKNAQWAGRQLMVGFTLPITIFAATAGKAFYTLDQQLTNIVKVYGDLNSQMSGDQIKQLRSEITGLAMDLAKAWGTSSDVTLGVAQQMAAVGKQGADLIQSTREAVRLSTLGGVDSEQSMKTILSMQSAFKISTQDLADSINFLNAVENQTSATLEDFTQALPIAGPAVHALGGDIKELALMLVAMREGGISANQAANALKTSLGRLINPTKAAKDLVKTFGIDLAGIVDKTQGDPVQTIEALAKAMEPLTRLQKDQVMAKIFGLQQYSRMTALFDNINKKSSEGLASQTEQVKELIAASGSQLAQVADQEIGRIADSASGKFNRAWESTKLALAGIGNVFLDLATKALNVLTPVLNFFNSWPDALKTAVAGGLGVAALIGPVVMMMGLMNNMRGTIRSFKSAIRNRIEGRNPDAAVETADEAGRRLAKDANILDNQMYDSAKATLVWTDALEKLRASLSGLHADMLIAAQAQKGAVLPTPGMMSAAGRSQIATTLMARDSGHTILPGKVEEKLSDQWLRLVGPTRTIPQESVANGKQSDTFGTFFGKPGLAQVSPATFSHAVAQSALFEKMLAEDEKMTVAEINNLIKLSRTNTDEFRKQINVFYQKYATFFEALESETVNLSEQIQGNIQRFALMSEGEAEASLKQSLNSLGVSWERFQQALNGRAYDVRSLAAQLDTHFLLENSGLGNAISKTRRTGTSIEDPYARVGQLTSAMNAVGLPVSASTLDEGVAGAAQHITEAGETFAKEVTSVTAKEAAERFYNIRDQKIIAQEEYRVARNKWKLETDMARKWVLYQEMVAKRTAMYQLQSADKEAAIELAAAQKAAAILVDGAAVASGKSTRGGVLGNIGRKMGPVGGAAMGLGMLATMLPDTGNASMNNASDILGGVGMGAGVGSMIPGVGTAIGAVVGGLLVGLPKLIDYLNRAGEASKAAFEAGDTAASKFGARIKSITDIQMSDMISKVGGVTSAYQDFLDGFKNAEDGSADKKFIDMLTGADPNTIKDLLQKRIAAGFAAGLKPDQIKAEIMAALAASGNSGQLGIIDQLFGVGGAFDPAKALQAQAQKASQTMAELWTKAMENAPKPVRDPGTGEITQQAIEDNKIELENYKQGILASQEYKDAIQGVADAYISLATSMKAADFSKFINGYGAGGMDSKAFLGYLKQIPGIGPDVVNAMQALSDHGATTEQMLEAINLKSQGVIKTWGEMQSLEPARLDIILTINQTQTAITNDIVGPLLAKARAALANIKKATLLDAKQVQKESKARQDAWKAEQKAVTEHYNKEIQKIKDADAARQKAFDAEQKRLDRLKQMRDFAISYREAIASGDMAGAAHIQNNMEITQAGWKNQDAADAAKAASDAKIAALEKERDAKLDAIQKAMDADEKATQATLDNIDKINAARTKQNQAEINAAQDRVNKLVELNNQPWNEENKAKVAAAAGLTGKQIGISERAALIKEIGSTGGAIWDKVGGDLSQAPWDLIAKLVNDKINGDPKDVLEDIKLINAWNPTASSPKTGTTGKGSLGNKPIPLSTGGPVWGAGTATSDSINARLSHGEFVMKAASVNKYGQAFMHAINEGRFASGGLVGSLGGSLAKKSIFSAVEGIVSGLFNPGTDAGRSNVPSGGLAQVIGNGIGATIAKWAEQFVGVPYSRTGSNPHDGWGCAPFVNYVYSHFGHPLPSATLSNAQFNGLHRGVNRNDLTAGDLVFFHYKNGVNVGNAVNHVGMALNGSSMIEAANPRAGTRISGIDWANFVGARRVLDPSGKAYRDGGLLMYGQGGEFMMSRNAVQTYGVDMMNAMNNRKFHTGGLVTAGGPVLNRGAAMAAGETNIHVYPSPGMDEECLADLVIQKIEIHNRRKGSGR